MKRIIYGSLSVLTAITTAFVSAEANARSITLPTAQAQVVPAEGLSDEMTEEEMAEEEMTEEEMAEEETIEAEPTETVPADGVVAPIAPTSDELAPTVPTPAQPGLTAPELTEPGLTEPGLSEPGPEVSDPSLIESDMSEPDLTEPDMEIDMSEPGLTEPGLTEPGLTEPDLGESELDESEEEPVPPAPGFPSAPIEPAPGFPSAPVEPTPLPPLEEDTPLDDSAVPGDEFPIGASSSDRLVGEGFTPFQLSYLAIAGGLKEEGIPGGSVLLSAYDQGDISAADIVDAGALSNRLGTAADDQADYTDGVERFLELLERDARND